MSDTYVPVQRRAVQRTVRCNRLLGRVRKEHAVVLFTDLHCKRTSHR